MAGWRLYSSLVSSSWLDSGLRVSGNHSIGCTNNNYASREKCKKCGQPKEVAAMPAIAIPGASLPTHPNYFARAQAVDQKMNIGLVGNGALQQFSPLSSNWSLGRDDRNESQPADLYGLHPASAWPLGRKSTAEGPHAIRTSQLLTAPKGWRNGDWICTCGFHNYSSRAQCKKCNTAVPPTASSGPLVGAAITALGTKRLASEELVHGWDNKRLNAGQSFEMRQACLGVESRGGSCGNQPSNAYLTFSGANLAVAQNVVVNLPTLNIPSAPTLPVKGATEWRDGDWMCTNCHNHNYASRTHCNRCKTKKDMLTQQVLVS